ncbi:hypothetical protein C0Q77_06895 [Klebsiella pneumoniae]|nr:hypothetical protein [Klebsiella pneumoniae]
MIFAIPVLFLARVFGREKVNILGLKASLSSIEFKTFSFGKPILTVRKCHHLLSAVFIFRMQFWKGFLM